MLALRLPAEIEERLEKLAKETGRTKTFYATQAILEHLEDIEDYYAAEKAYAEYIASGKKTFSLEEVRKELDLER